MCLRYYDTFGDLKSNSNKMESVISSVIEEIEIILNYFMCTHNNSRNMKNSYRLIRFFKIIWDKDYVGVISLIAKYKRGRYTKIFTNSNKK